MFPYDIDSLHPHRFYPGPVSPAPWMSAGAAAAASQKTLPDEEIQPLEERVRLADDVVGHAL